MFFWNDLVVTSTLSQLSGKIIYLVHFRSEKNYCQLCISFCNLNPQLITSLVKSNDPVDKLFET
jgi:hypothetical protein